jgi:uncharacterized protein
MANQVFQDASGRLRPGWRFVVAVVLLIIVQVIAAVVARTVVPPAAGILSFESVFRPLSLALVVALFAWMVKVADRSDQRPLAAQGLDSRIDWMRQFLWGCGLGVLLIGIAVGIVGTFGGYYAERIPINYPAVLAVIWVTLTAAALEEVCFRGYPFQKLTESVGPYLAIAILSLLFGALHLLNAHSTWLGFINTALVGVPFAIFYLRTGQLWLPIGLHFAWNLALGTLFGLPVSGVSFFAVIHKGTAIGPAWLTGGNYGIEASLTGTFVILLGIGCALFLVPRQKTAAPRNAPADLSL